MEDKNKPLMNILKDNSKKILNYKLKSLIWNSNFKIALKKINNYKLLS